MYHPHGALILLKAIYSTCVLESNTRNLLIELLQYFQQTVSIHTSTTFYMHILPDGSHQEFINE